MSTTYIDSMETIEQKFERLVLNNKEIYDHNLKEKQSKHSNITSKLKRMTLKELHEKVKELEKQRNREIEG